MRRPITEEGKTGVEHLWLNISARTNIHHAYEEKRDCVVHFVIITIPLNRFETVQNRSAAKKYSIL